MSSQQVPDSIFAKSLHFFNLARAKSASFIIKHLFWIVIISWICLAFLSPLKLIDLYQGDTTINSTFLNIMTIYLVIIASLTLAFEKCIQIPELINMRSQLQKIIPYVLNEIGLMSNKEEVVPFIDKSVDDYKELLKHSEQFREWHRNIYIWELFLIFFICILCFLDMALIDNNNVWLSTMWNHYRFSIFFNFTSIVTFVIFLHAFIDLLQHKLFLCIGIDAGSDNIIEKFTAYKKQTLNIDEKVRAISQEEEESR